jgi:type I restriction enzyme S subunit
MTNYKINRLGGICKVINGKAYKQEELLDSGKYRVLRVGNFFTNNSWYYSNLELNDDKYCDFGDLLFAWSASFGPRIWKGNKTVYHYHIWKLVEDRNIIDRSYLFYYLQNKTLSFMSSTHGSIMLHLTKSFMEDLPVSYPIDINYQKQIAKVLSDLDSKIEINNKINKELEAMAKTLYDYWFVQFDFPDENGKPYKSYGGKMVFNEELKREIPEGWENKKLSNFAECNKWNRTKESSYDKINYLDTSSLTRNVIESYQKLDFVKDKIPSRAQRIVSENDILYSTVRPNQLHYGIIKKPIENLIVSTGFAQIRSKDPKVTNDFIYQVLSQDYISVRLHQIAVGSVSAYPSISHNDIMNLDIAFPMESNLIEKATVTFQQCNEKIAINLEQHQKLSELRDWLLPMLMNGQVSVGYAKKEVEGLGLVAEGDVKYGDK